MNLLASLRYYFTPFVRDPVFMQTIDQTPTPLAGQPGHVVEDARQLEGAARAACPPRPLLGDPQTSSEQDTCEPGISPLYYMRGFIISIKEERSH